MINNNNNSRLGPTDHLCVSVVFSHLPPRFNCVLILKGLVHSISSRIGDDDDSDNDAVQADGSGEDLDDQHLHEGTSLVGLGQGGAGSHDTDGDARGQVGEAHDGA